MKIVLYAFDVGPGRLASLVGLEATMRSHVVTYHVNGTLGNLKILEDRPDVLMTALPSFDTEAQSALIELFATASDCGTGIVICPDTHEAWGRPFFKAHAGRVNLVIVAHSEEVALAQRWGYRRAVFPDGLPPHWGYFCRTAPGREYVRHTTLKTKTGAMDIPLDTDDVLVVVSGIKDPRLNNRMLRGVVAAGRGVFAERFVVAPRFHPREFNAETPRELREPIEAERREILAGVWKADTMTFKTTEENIPGADLVVSTGGGTAVIYGALCRRSTIHYEDDPGDERMAKQLGRTGWFPTDRGAALVARGPEGLIAAIRQLSTVDGALELQKAQGVLYPDALVRAAITQPTEKNIADILEREFGKKQ